MHGVVEGSGTWLDLCPCVLQFAEESFCLHSHRLHEILQVRGEKRLVKSRYSCPAQREVVCANLEH